MLGDKEATLYYGFMKDKPLAELIIHSKPSLIPSSIRLASAEPELVQEWDSAKRECRTSDIASKSVLIEIVRLGKPEDQLKFWKSFK